jgi:hypothetical protein
MRGVVATLAVLALGTGCQGENAVTAVAFTVREYPSSGAMPWSCLGPTGATDEAGAEAARWSVGTPLVVTPSAVFERPCGGPFGADCPDPALEVAAVDAAVWTLDAGPAPGAAYGGPTRQLEAIAAGVGGVKVTAQGQPFAPLLLGAVAPAALRFFRTTTPSAEQGGAPLMTPIDALTLTAGESATVVPALLAQDGGRLCGQVPAKTTATNATVAGEPTWNAQGRANAPLRVTAGARGAARVELAAAGATGTLPIVVE